MENIIIPGMVGSYQITPNSILIQGKAMRTRRIICFIACLIMVLTTLLYVAFTQAQNKPLVGGLLTNGVENPMAIDIGTPEFSWKITSNSRDCLQQAYQIVITSPRDGGIVWDSGKTESTTSSGIMYAGPALSADTPYQWKVTVWTNQGGSTDSADATFRVGLMKEDWNAQYIWDATQKANDFAYVRKGFMVADKPILDAVV